MLTPIDLNDELSRGTREIRDAASDRMLPSKFPWQFVLSERVPEAPLDLRCLTPKSACTDRSLAQWHGPTSPNLSAPQGRRGNVTMEAT